MSTTKKVIQKKQRELAKSYDPQEFESSIYRYWEENGCFEASDENAPGQKAFCIMIPPPNVTGVLHIGHALTNTIEDILTRWRRMCGDNTLWLPGTDHAGIATQMQVEKSLAKEKNAEGRPLSRHDLGREEFLERTWKWKEDHHGRIVGQLRRLGCSLDWSRERFTLDEGLSQAVREVFVRLYEEGLIYRGERIINWSVGLQTSLSDLEVIPTERKGFLWHIRYPIVEEDGTPVQNPDGSDAVLIVATTRPETLLGDSAVAVHPEDERYLHLHGKMAKLPLLGRLIPVITDSYVDREFGTGALKVTPAHDFNDYEIGLRHSLPRVTIMGRDGRVSAAGGPFAGLKMSEAREQVIQELKEQRLLEKTEDHALTVGVCQRSGQVVEPMISKQWFVKIDPLAKPAIEAVESGKIQFTPKSWEKTYFEWMYNIRDWCISRQLWWGHRIPAWYCARCQEITVSRVDPKKCQHCDAPSSELKQDDDVLDTWFSSGLWPFSTLGWPEKTPALKTFYPGTVMETGFDIIFFWVARMIMMGLHFMKEIPFQKVYLHAMVRDEKGEKMSKTKGNVIDPLEIVEQQGADPLRFTLAIMAGQGRDVKLSPKRIEGYRGFCNKLWNATKFFHLNWNELANDLQLEVPAGGLEKWLSRKDVHVQLSPSNRWILSKLNRTIVTVQKGLEDFELNVSAQALYDFAWHEVCDWYIELSKLPLKEGSDEQKRETLLVFRYVLEQLLRLLHPFIPFVTEELWQSLPWKTAVQTPQLAIHQRNPIETLMLQAFPASISEFMDEEAERNIDALKSVIEAIRNFRGENRIPPKKEFPVRYITQSSAADVFVKLHRDEILALTRISSLDRATEDHDKAKSSSAEALIPLINPPLDLKISLEGLVDVEEERRRIRKEIDKTQSDLEHIQKKLGNEAFVSRAPAELVTQERTREKDLQSKLTELQTSFEKLPGA